MGDPARSPFFRSHQTEPLSTVLINANGNPIEYIDCVADTANLKACLLAYISASTYANEITEAPADFGDVATEAFPLLIEIPDAHKNLPDNYDKTNGWSDGDGGIKALKLYKGMHVWLKGSTLTAAQGETLVHAASGLVTNVGDPDGKVHAVSQYAYKALTALSAGTWIPCEVLGLTSIDATA
jgi:hypothetical protein